MDTPNLRIRARLRVSSHLTLFRVSGGAPFAARPFDSSPQGAPSDLTRLLGEATGRCVSAAELREIEWIRLREWRMSALSSTPDCPTADEPCRRVSPDTRKTARELSPNGLCLTCNRGPTLASEEAAPPCRGYQVEALEFLV